MRDSKVGKSERVENPGRTPLNLTSNNKSDAIMLAPESYGSVIDPIG